MSARPATYLEHYAHGDWRVVSRHVVCSCGQALYGAMRAPESGPARLQAALVLDRARERSEGVSEPAAGYRETVAGIARQANEASAQANEARS